MTDVQFIWWRVWVPKVLSQGSAAWVIMGQSSKASTRRICLLAIQSKWLSNPLISLLCHLKPPSCGAMPGQKEKKTQQQPTKSGLPKTKMWKWNQLMEEISDDWTIWWWHFNKVSFSAWDEALRKRRVGSLSTVDGVKQLCGIRQNRLLTSQRCFGDSVFFFLKL